MRHRKVRSRLSMMPARRKATIANMVTSLLKHQRIKTTLARAKEARRIAERMITLSKTDTVHSRRLVYRTVQDRDVIHKLFREISPLFKDKSSGFTRIIPLGFRRGDGAAMAILELTEKKVVEKQPKKKAKAAAAARPKGEEEAKKAAAPEAKKETPKAKPTLEEEKRAQAAKTEEKRIADKKGFMKNLRGFFRRKTDM